MNSVDSDSVDNLGDSLEETPAVGFVATEENADAVVRETVRAMQNGYDCLVAYSDPEPTEAVSLVEDLGATVLGPLDAGRYSERETLDSAARALSYPGIIFVPNHSPPIDYRRSTEKLVESDAFSVDSVKRSGKTWSSPRIVAIPAYNEASTIGEVVREATGHADEVLVVDDGSNDDTATVARGAGATVVEHEKNRGYGSALQTAFEEAAARDTSALVCLDADGQHDPAEIPRLLERIDSGAELVIGNRFDGDSDIPFYRRFGLFGVNVLTNLSMGVIRRQSWINDTQSGFRAYGSSIIESVAESDGLADHMGASTDLLHHAHERNYDIEEVGVTVDYEVENPSNHDPVRHGLTLVSNILRTVERERPITIIGIPGFVLALIGIGLGYFSIVNYLSTATFPGGIALLAGFSTLIGVLACFTAIILHSLTVHLSEIS